MKISRFLAAVLTAVLFAAPAVRAQELTDPLAAADAAAAPASDVPSLEASVESTLVAVKVIQATVTGYANGADGGAVGTVTASGVHTHWGTVAADWRLYPLGTRLQIEGFPNVIFTIEDTGGGVHGNLFDVWFPDLATAVAFGTKSLSVTVLQ